MRRSTTEIVVAVSALLLVAGCAVLEVNETTAISGKVSEDLTGLTTIQAKIEMVVNYPERPSMQEEGSVYNEPYPDVFFHWGNNKRPEVRRPEDWWEKKIMEYEAGRTTPVGRNTKMEFAVRKAMENALNSGINTVFRSLPTNDKSLPVYALQVILTRVEINCSRCFEMTRERYLCTCKIEYRAALVSKTDGRELDEYTGEASADYGSMLHNPSPVPHAIGLACRKVAGEIVRKTRSKASSD